MEEKNSRLLSWNFAREIFEISNESTDSRPSTSGLARRAACLEGLLETKDDSFTHRPAVASDGTRLDREHTLGQKSRRLLTQLGFLDHESFTSIYPLVGDLATIHRKLCALDDTPFREPYTVIVLYASNAVDEAANETIQVFSPADKASM